MTTKIKGKHFAKSQKQTFVLPWPPSVNNIYGQKRTKGKKSAGRFLKKHCVDFKANVRSELLGTGFKPLGHQELKLRAFMYPPDKRRRDLDNCLKLTQDALEEAGLFENDSQIIDLHMTKESVRKPGYMIIEIEPTQPPSAPIQ